MKREVTRGAFIVSLLAYACSENNPTPSKDAATFADAAIPEDAASSEEDAAVPEDAPTYPDASDPACAPDNCPAPRICDEAGLCTLEWPNTESSAVSDPWLAEHHDELRKMRPRILAINYVNDRTMSEMRAQLGQMIEVLNESSRWHGYSSTVAPFLEYELTYELDLRDPTPPPGWMLNNSTFYPREDPPEGYWSFDYEQLFTEKYAALLGIEDPANPGVNLRLCDAIDRGLVHEIWIYGDADLPDVSAAEILELKPRYDETGQRLAGPLDPCAGNGCFDAEDDIPCTRTVRIAWCNNTRGPGCFLESLSHGFESIGRRNGDIIPYLSQYFPELSNQQLDQKYGAPVASWYSCPYGTPCLSYLSENSLRYTIGPTRTGTITDYDPICGNVHWAPNATQHYDLTSTAAVRSSCTHWRDGTTMTALYTGAEHAAYERLASDCMGPFLVWWRQNLPGLDNNALDDSTQPMKNWWPFLYY